ncbi:MAG: hypothetical protein AAB401_12420, partial [Acidobacteriota bacterium]
MTRSLRKAVIATTLLSLIIGAVSPSVYSQSQGRLDRAPARDVEGTQPIPVNSTVIPANTIIILEIDDQLSSSNSRVGDRFRAHVASPVTDTAGKMIIPVGTIIEGHVSAVRKAKWRHRSGTLSIVFDRIRKLDNSATDVRATLTSAKAEERKRLDEEYNLKSDSTLVRDIVFIGGGAGAGAAIGIFTGGALMGAGIGAAVGLTAVLLMKGKDVVVEQSDRFGMVLVQPIPAKGFVYEPPTRPTQAQVPTPAPTLDPNKQYPGPLNPYDATVSRESSDGSVKVRMNAEAPSPGWRVFSNHDDPLNGVARIRLRGTPPGSNIYNAQLKQLTPTPVPEICLDDPSRVIRRIDFMDKSGRLSFSVEVPQSGSRYGRAPVGTTNPVTTNPQQPPPPVASQPGQQPPAGSVAGMAQSAAFKVDYIRREYAAVLGYQIDRNNQANFWGTPQQQAATTVDQKQFFDGLM